MQALSRITSAVIPIEMLRDDINKICGAFEIEPPYRCGPSHGLARKQKISGFDIALVSQDVAMAARTRTCIRRDPGEHFFMLIQDFGQCVVHQNGTSTMLAPGDMFIVDATQPSKFIYNGQLTHQVSIHLPRDEILGRFGTACDGGIAIDRDDPLWLAMRAVLVKMLRSSSEASGQLSEAFYGLMGAYFQERRSQVTDPRGQTIERALGLIARHYRDPEFGPGALALRLGVSLRSLQRYFEALGETPGQRLVQKRLSQAYADLSRDEGAEVSVVDCAYACGFNDLSHFYRAFRQRYGMTPGEVKSRSQTAGAIAQ
ncbi:helix-turn-helix domain-containing protein [Sulfitobacter sp. F26204]|uniref:helix-turn-helix domain-containing protein n=1 Tax=Sulfitobacter sp. F26204 TaxID=2996014 RepID=UPI00225E5725|nr:helix-turn-helix domain-containing protein [Sulfitobacter sp. F26204]MCX7561740.1 helix-turn-helix domain-containing protein [Sulfitobacter sp. F26204]